MDVLSSTQISAEVLNLIESAKQVLVLVSPYFDPWDRLLQEIRRATLRPGLKVVLLLRGGDDRAKQEEKARELASLGVQVSYLSRLHAKVYLNERQALVTSMNLLKSSALDSWELALRLDAVQDAAAFHQVVKATSELLQRAKDEEKVANVAALQNAAGALLSSVTEQVVPTLAKQVAASLAGPKKRPTLTAPPDARPRAKARVSVGFCVRCAEQIPLNPERPLCASCYKAWARFSNPDYKESHCHACGGEASTTFAKPRCRSCWQASA